MQVVAPLLLALLLAGCAASRCPVPAPPAPQAPPAAPPAASLAPPAAARALKRDTAAVQQHARQYVAKPSTSAKDVEKLEPLTRAVNRSLAVMELHHRREGRYRPADVRAARTAADAVAGFLDAQPPPREDPAP